MSSTIIQCHYYESQEVHFFGSHLHGVDLSPLVEYPSPLAGKWTSSGGTSSTSGKMNRQVRTLPLKLMLLNSARKLPFWATIHSASGGSFFRYIIAERDIPLVEIGQHCAGDLRSKKSALLWLPYCTTLYVHAHEPDFKFCINIVG